MPAAVWAYRGWTKEILIVFSKVLLEKLKLTLYIKYIKEGTGPAGPTRSKKIF